jgi:hypothetical protein
MEGISAAAKYLASSRKGSQQEEHFFTSLTKMQLVQLKEL